MDAGCLHPIFSDGRKVKKFVILKKEDRMRVRNNLMLEEQ